MASVPAAGCWAWVCDARAEDKEARDRRLAIDDDFFDVGQDFFHCFDIDPLADDVFGLIVFFQGCSESVGLPWARFSRAWALPFAWFTT